MGGIFNRAENMMRHTCFAFFAVYNRVIITGNAVLTKKMDLSGKTKQLLGKICISEKNADCKTRL